MSSQQIFGSVSNEVRNNYGNFVTIINMRIRQDMILGYCLSGPVIESKHETDIGKYAINVYIGGQWTGSKPATLSECEHVITYLDKLYQKEYGVELAPVVPVALKGVEND